MEMPGRVSPPPEPWDEPPWRLPMAREQQYLQDATVAFNERTEAGIKAGVAELRALDQQIVARGGGTLDSARAMRGAFLAGRYVL